MRRFYELTQIPHQHFEKQQVLLLILGLNFLFKEQVHDIQTVDELVHSEFDVAQLLKHVQVRVQTSRQLRRVLAVDDREAPFHYFMAVHLKGEQFVVLLHLRRNLTVIRNLSH